MDRRFQRSVSRQLKARAPLLDKQLDSFEILIYTLVDSQLRRKGFRWSNKFGYKMYTATGLIYYDGVIVNHILFTKSKLVAFGMKEKPDPKMFVLNKVLKVHSIIGFLSDLK